MTRDDISKVLFGPGVDSTTRPLVLADWAEGLGPTDGALFWRVVIDAWSRCDLIPHRRFSRLFVRFATDRPPVNVAGVISIYRGQDGEARPIGLSWTTDLDVADRFAIGHRGKWSANPVVYETTATPKQIAFTSDDRSEREIVLLRSPRRFWVSDEWQELRDWVAAEGE